MQKEGIDIMLAVASGNMQDSEWPKHHHFSHRGLQIKRDSELNQGKIPGLWQWPWLLGKSISTLYHCLLWLWPFPTHAVCSVVVI